MKKKILRVIFILVAFLLVGITPALAYYKIPNSNSTSIGIWDPVKRIFTLTSDVNGAIWVVEDNLTLDGAGHMLRPLPSETGFGVKVYLRKGVTVKNLNVQGFFDGIELIASSNNTLTGNTVSNNDHGIYLSSKNTLTGNTAWGMGHGIYLFYSSNNTLTGNTVSNNDNGIYLYNSSNNQIYKNNFIDNWTQANVLYGNGNVFNLDKPIGGNYWDNWTTPDADGDGFVDNPYIFTGGQDDLPCARQDGWLDYVGPICYRIQSDPNPAVAVDTEVTLTATVDDTGRGDSNIASAEFSLDGGEWFLMDPVDYAFDSPTEDVTATFYAPMEAGHYDLCVGGTDEWGNEGDPECILLVVYDPDAGFVTGAGWIQSPQGAYTADPLLTGKANFGFVSKYKKGAKVPTGQTEFQIHVADLNFHSDSYDWLDVTGEGTAIFKGEGTINGETDVNGNLYKFMIWARDDHHDTFQIKIWSEDASGSETVYDNGSDQKINGGSIVIHTSNKKWKHPRQGH